MVTQWYPSFEPSKFHDLGLIHSMLAAFRLRIAYEQIAWGSPKSYVTH
jgi:hypothetical protein